MFKNYLELSKPRICFLALMMAAFGYYLGGGHGFFNLGLLLLGLGAVGASSGILNQVMEVEVDRKMHRTSLRPLPTERVEVRSATWIGVGLGAFGVLFLLMVANPLTSVLAAATLFFYLAVYTPSKLQSWLSIFLGAIPGALPPVMGYTAASGHLDLRCLLLFGILFFWQIPHFFSLAWIYRQDYERGGVKVLPVVDPSGVRTFHQSVVATLVLILWSLLPFLTERISHLYTAGVALVGVAFLFTVLRWVRHPTLKTAKVAFFGSLLYLPIWGILWVWQG